MPSRMVTIHSHHAIFPAINLACGYESLSAFSQFIANYEHCFQLIETFLSQPIDTGLKQHIY